MGHQLIIFPGFLIMSCEFTDIKSDAHGRSLLCDGRCVLEQAQRSLEAQVS